MNLPFLEYSTTFCLYKAPFGRAFAAADAGAVLTAQVGYTNILLAP